VSAKPSLVDRLLRRLGYQKRPQLGAYAAGMHHRTAADWYPALLSADQHIKAHRHLLVARSRQMVRDNPHAARLVALFQQNIIGPAGIRLQAKVPKSRPAPDAMGIGPNKPKPAIRPTTSNAIEDGWRDWGRAGVCTVDGKQSWDDVCDLLVATLFIDGEFLALRRRGFPNEHGYALQILDTLQLDSSLNHTGGDGRNEISVMLKNRSRIVGLPGNETTVRGFSPQWWGNAAWGERGRNRAPSTSMYGTQVLAVGHLEGGAWKT